MKCRTQKLALALALLHLALPTDAANRPQAPAGYEWSQCETMKAQFLVPEGWNFREEENSDTPACFVTKENIAQSGSFVTGLTVNQIKDIPGKRGVTAHQFATVIVDRIAKENDLIHQGSWEAGPFVATACEYLDVVPSKPTIRMYMLFLANPSTETLHIVIFEAPESEWEFSWSLITPVLENLGFDDAI